MDQRKKITYSIFGAVILTVVVLALIPTTKQRLVDEVVSVKNYVQYNNIVADMIRQQFFPETMLNSSSQPKEQLSRTDVISLTNKERQNQGVPVLTENAQLDAAAQQKLDDMFTQQYFDHISPQGNGPAWIADQVGYSYVIVGENLALGDFKDNAALVAAWMASPGHRANILNTKFVDIGVAVKQGTYEGEKVWIAVQEFGKPLSDCPSIDNSMKTMIEQNRIAVEAKSRELNAEKDSLAAMSQNTPAEQEAYNANVGKYNAEVASYNNDASMLKAEIQSYNAEVQAFNACLKQ